MRWLPPPDEGAKQPSKRYGCSAVGIDSRVLCFGGTQGSAPNNELWLLEVGQSGKVEWKQPQVRGVAPSPRAAHTASLLAPPGRAATHMVVFGGAEADGFVLFDDASFLSLYPPEADGKGPQLIFRSEIEASVDAAENVTITHLQPREHALGRPLSLEWVAPRVARDRCEEAEPAWPAPRQAHAAAALFDGRLLVHGGWGSSYTQFGDAWVLDTEAALGGALAASPWSPLDATGTPPPPSAGHRAATVGLRVVLAGGELGDAPWVLDASTMAWTTLGGRDGLRRSFHGAVALGRRLLIHGGTDADTDSALDDALVVPTDAGAGGDGAETQTASDGAPGGVIARGGGRPPAARSLHAVARVGTRLAFIGGKGGRHGLAMAEESADETARRLAEEAELVDEIRGLLRRMQAAAKKDAKRDKATAAAEKAAAAAEKAAAESAAAKAARDAELKRRGDEALRKEQEEARRKKLAEEEARKAASLRTGGGFKLEPK